MTYDGIFKAAELIARDNGGINRYRSEAQWKRELSHWLALQPGELLPAIDAWLLSLSGDDLDMVTTGEQSEADRVLQSAPPFTDRLLNDYFNEVC